MDIDVCARPTTASCVVSTRIDAQTQHTARTPGRGVHTSYVTHLVLVLVAGVGRHGEGLFVGEHRPDVGGAGHQVAPLVAEVPAHFLGVITGPVSVDVVGWLVCVQTRMGRYALVDLDEGPVGRLLLPVPHVHEAGRRLVLFVACCG